MQKPVRNLLIYRLGSLGDTIMTLPCFHRVRECFPEATITLLTNRPVAAKAAPVEAVLGTNYFFDRVLDYPLGTRNPRVLASLIRQIRALKIDTVVNLAAARSPRSVVRDAWFFRVAGASRLIGFPATPNDFAAALDPTTGQHEWEARRLARRLTELGPIDLTDDRYWDLRFTEAERRVAAQVLATVAPQAPTLVVCAGTKMQAKDWGAQNWLSLVARLRTDLPDYRLMMIGAPDEAALADQCLAVWNGPGLNLCGKTSPRESAAVLQQADVFVGHDSGPMHLAGCVGTPCVAVFASISVPGQWYPRGQANQIIYHQTDCAGCGLETCIDQKKKCILSITVDEVRQAVIQVITHNQRRKTGQFGINTP